MFRAFSYGILAVLSVPVGSYANIGAEAPAPVEIAEFITAPTWTPEAGDTIEFAVLRKGKPFGTHTVSFDQSEDGGLNVSHDVDLEVKFGPVTFFKYTFDSSENWKDGKLMTLSSKTVDGDREDKLSVERNADTLKVSGTGYNGDLAGTMLPITHWTVNQVASESLMSTEDGVVFDMNSEFIGTETIKVAGEDITANRYRMSADVAFDIWYDMQGRWVNMEFEVRDQEITYKLKSLY